MNAKKIARIGIISSLAVVIGYIESFFPPIIPVAGFKIGLSNIAIMYALYKMGKQDAFLVMIVKVLITSLWFQGLNALIFSLFGGVFSLVAMIFADKLGLSKTGVGMSGGVFHNVGQILAAAIVLGTTSAFYYILVLIPSGLLTGALVSVLASILIKYTKNV